MADLRQLMAAYFHQDWAAEYDGSSEAAVDDFARREPTRVARAIEEIDSLLATTTTDAELAASLDSLGNNYWPGDAAGAHTTWLRAVRSRLASRPGSGSAEEP